MSFTIMPGAENTQPYEIITLEDQVRIHVSVPGLSRDDIEVHTSGIILFIKSNLEDSIPENAKRIDGGTLTPPFSMEFIIDPSAVMGTPYLDSGVLIIPILVDSETTVSTRKFAVLEAASAGAVLKNDGDTSNWAFKDAYK